MSSLETISFKLSGLRFQTNGSVVKLETNLPKSVDRAVRRSSGKGSINTNPPRKDCLSWYDKKQGKWVNKWDNQEETKCHGTENTTQ